MSILDSINDLWGECMKKRFWVEKWVGGYALYFGFLTKGDLRLGIGIGNKEGHIDLLFFTFGYMQ